MLEELGLDKRGQDCLLRIKSEYVELSDAHKKVADYILKNPAKIVHLSVSEMAEVCGVSEATVVRFAKNLGYDGFHAMKIFLAGELSSAPSTDQIHEDVLETDDIRTLMRKVFASEIQALQDTLNAIDEVAFERAVDAIAGARQIGFHAFGNSRTVAMDAHYRFLRIGLLSYVSVDIANDHILASMMTPRDVAIGISHSGSSKHTVKALAYAKEAGATTICLTGFPKSPITKVSDICLYSIARETMFREEAMASRVAQNCIMDALYVAVAFRRLEESHKNPRTTAKILLDEKF
mgnify:FL=1